MQYVLIIWTLVLTRNLRTDMELDAQRAQNASVNQALLLSQPNDSSIQQRSTSDSSDVYKKPPTDQLKRKTRPSSASLQPKQGGQRYAKPAMSIISERTESAISMMSGVQSQPFDEYADKRKSSNFAPTDSSRPNSASLSPRAISVQIVVESPTGRTMDVIREE